MRVEQLGLIRGDPPPQPPAVRPKICLPIISSQLALTGGNQPAIVLKCDLLLNGVNLASSSKTATDDMSYSLTKLILALTTSDSGTRRTGDCSLIIHLRPIY